MDRGEVFHIMRLTKEGGKWIAISTFQEKDLPKQAGFRWEPALKQWWTDQIDKACQLADFAEEDIRAELTVRRDERDKARVASRRVTTDFNPPAPEGLEYRPFQKAGIEQLCEMKRCLLADQMRLGKTIQAIGWVNVRLQDHPDMPLPKVLVIPPAYLKLNWQREMVKWFIAPLSIQIIAGTTKNSRTTPEGFDVSVINYNILPTHKEDLLRVNWDFIFIDEAHYLKNKKTQRYKNCKEILDHNPSACVTLMTGTPIVNFPIELFQLLELVDPIHWNEKTFFRYAKRYCAATQKEVVIGYDRQRHQKITRMVWDFTGKSNLSELQNELRATIMIRRMRADVLKDQPPKQRQLIVIPREGPRHIPEDYDKARIEEWRAAKRLEAEALANDNQEQFALAASTLEGCKVAFTEMSELRKEIGLEKVPHAIEYVANALDEDFEQKIVVFAWHQEVVEQMAIGLEKYGVVVVTGKTNLTRRDANIESFMTDPKCRVFAANMQAAGVGINLSVSDLVVFVEEDYVPGNIDQAEDRVIAMDKNKPISVVHFALDRTLDGEMIAHTIDKQNTIDQATTIKGVEESRDNTKHFRELDRQATEQLAKVDHARSHREEVLREYHLTDEKISAIHSMLRMLAGLDTDFAQEKNDIGFNRVDGGFGHKLAESSGLTPKQAFYGAKLLRKYRRQLPSHLYELVFSENGTADSNVYS